MLSVSSQPLITFFIVSDSCSWVPQGSMYATSFTVSYVIVGFTWAIFCHVAEEHSLMFNADPFLL
jgi:hypothetical protein